MVCPWRSRLNYGADLRSSAGPQIQAPLPRQRVRTCPMSFRQRPTNVGRPVHANECPVSTEAAARDDRSGRSATHPELHSELPGLVTAQVTENTYDSSFEGEKKVYSLA